MREPLILLSSRVSFHRYRECIRYAKEHLYQGIEWYLDYYRLPSWKGLRHRFFDAVRESGLLFGFHGPVNDVELAIKDKTHATVALDYLKMYLDFLEEVAPVYFIIHIGARHIPVEELSWENTLDHLKRLVEHGDSRKIKICIENLTHGWTSDPELLMKMAETVGASITFDVGHARGSRWVTENKGTVFQFLDIISPKIFNAHIYEYENDKGEHLVPGGDSRIAPILDELTRRGCSWWVLELNNYEETEETFQFVTNYLKGKGGQI
jgi:sugar phosphate isomerase/epimerase